MTTAQELFNAAYLGVIGQGVPSMRADEEGSCLYRLRLDNGTVLKCGVGWCLTDEEYNDQMDDELAFSGKGATVAVLAERHLLPKRLVPHLTLLQALQSAHDGAAYMRTAEAFLSEFKSRMLGIADEFDLTIPGEA